MDELLRMVTRSYGSDAQVVQQVTKSGRWDPFQFIDLCMACHEGRQREFLPILLDIQQKEITSLLDYCIQQALGRLAEGT